MPSISFNPDSRLAKGQQDFSSDDNDDDSSELLDIAFSTKQCAYEQRRAFAPHSVQNTWGRIFLSSSSSRDRLGLRLVENSFQPNEELFRCFLFKDMIAPSCAVEHPDEEPAFLARAMRLDSTGYEESALDIVYDSIDDLMRSGRIVELNNMLVAVSPSKLSTDILIGILTATVPTRSHLEYRSKFFLAVKQEITNRGDYEEGLLSGLE